MVVKAATVADFDLLRDTRTDIRSLVWTEPAHREATTLYFGIKRAKEEIVRLNVEITRLLTFMYDTHVDYYLAIQRCTSDQPALAHELTRQWQYEERINEAIVRKLVQTAQLVKFSGDLHIGCRVGREPVTVEVPPPSWLSLLTTFAIPLSTSSTPCEEANALHTGADNDDVARELQVDADTIIQLYENLNM